VSSQQFQRFLKEQDGLVKVVKFRCNFCSANSEFIWMDGYEAADGFRVFQCLKCCAIGTKNLAEATDTQEPVIRCKQCGSWQFVDQKCHTCQLIEAK
jgi:hypothetical protein